MRFPIGLAKRHSRNSRRTISTFRCQCAPQGGVHRSDELVVRKRTLRVLTVVCRPVHDLLMFNAVLPAQAGIQSVQ